MFFFCALRGGFSPVDLWIGFASLLAFQSRSLVLNCPSSGNHKFTCRGLAAEENREALPLLWPLIALHCCAESQVHFWKTSELVDGRNPVCTICGLRCVPVKWQRRRADEPSIVAIEYGR